MKIVNNRTEKSVGISWEQVPLGEVVAVTYGGVVKSDWPYMKAKGGLGIHMRDGFMLEAKDMSGDFRYVVLNAQLVIEP